MSVEIRDDNFTDDVIRALEGLERHSVEIGILGESGTMADGNILMIAAVHEFGIRIKVTPKMRAWFAYQGFPLKKETIEINIPERSYIRAGWDKHVGEIGRTIDSMVEKVITLQMTPTAFYNNIGAMVTGKLQEYMTELQNPALSGMTVARRKQNSSNPLIDTGRLSQAITWRVVKN